MIDKLALPLDWMNWIELNQIELAIRGEGGCGTGWKDERIKQRKNCIDNFTVISWEKAGWVEVEEGKWEIDGDGRRLDLGW